jgi:hypothetical protein
MRKLKVLGILSAGVLAMVMAVSMTGCGNDASSVSKAAKTTTKSVSQDKDSSSQVDNAESKADEESKEAENAAEETMSKEEWDKLQKSEEHAELMDEQEAGQNALAGAADQIGEGDWRIESTEKSKSPGDGFDCWKIGVVNYANSQSPTYYFYCGDGFCIME